MVIDDTVFDDEMMSAMAKQMSKFGNLNLMRLSFSCWKVGVRSWKTGVRMLPKRISLLLASVYMLKSPTQDLHQAERTPNGTPCVNEPHG